MAALLSEAKIRELAGADSFSRGRSYFRNGAVRSVVRRGEIVEAAVQGSEHRPYQVRIRLPERGQISASCTCPYDWGGWCKHRVAAALALLETPAKVEEKAPLADLIAALSREELDEVLLSLLESGSSFANRFEQAIERRRHEAELAALRAESTTPGGATDPVLIARRIHAVLQGVELQESHHEFDEYDDEYYDDEYDEYYEEGYDYYDRYAEYADEYGEIGGLVPTVFFPVFDEVFELWSHAMARLEQGEPAEARAAAEAIILTALEDKTPLRSHARSLAEMLGRLDDELTQTLLTVDLGPDERKQWESALQKWSKRAARFIVPHGTGHETVEDAFEYAILLLGWRPQRESEIAAQVRDAPQTVPVELGRFLSAYLSRRNEHEAILALLRRTGSRTTYLDKLLELGRREEAVAYAESETWGQVELHNVINRLEQRGERLVALRIAVREVERAQGTSAEDTRLIAWVRDAASAIGEKQVALWMALRLVELSPALNTYAEAQKLAGKQWPEVKEKLLEKLRSTYRGKGSVQVIDIFLHEELHDDVLALLGPYIYPDLLVRLVDALSATHPDWAVEQSLRQAMSIIREGASAHYDTAIEWLRRVRDIFRGAGHPEHWDALVEELRTSDHGRKRKLMRLLDGIA